VCHESVTGNPARSARLARLALLAACGVLLGAAPDEEQDGDEEPPWFAPWRAIDVRTADDAAHAWELVRGFFGNMREGHPHEVWVTDEEDMPPARPLEACLDALVEAELAWPRVDHACRMSAQVQLSGSVGGVIFTSRAGETDPLVALGCELALRLPRIAEVLREQGVVEVVVGPPARFALKSYHRFGLALDVYELALDDGTRLVVEDDYVLQPDRGTCDGERPATAAGRKLREVACALFEARVLSTVITPNYNEGHRNHFHWDVRPGDERFYLR
jgi:hypothetical protein